MIRLAYTALVFLALFVFESETRADEKRLVNVGVTIPLSGGFVDWGTSIRQGIEIYAAQPGNRFKFDFQDESIGDAKLALSAYRKFRTGNIHFVIVGTMTGTKAVLPIAAKDQVLLLSAGLVDEEELSQSSKIISLATQLSTESAYLGQHIYRNGFRRVAIINRIDPFSEEFARTLGRSIQQLGAEVVYQQGLDPREADFRTILLRIKEANPDAICFNVTQDRQIELVKQIRELGLKSALFSNYDFEAPVALQNERLVSTVNYSFPYNSAESSSIKSDFDRKFEAHFGKEAKPGANTYFVYDGLTLLDQALSRCSSEDVQCVSEYFKSLKEFDGLAGKVSFHSDGSNIRPYGIKAVRNGNFVWLVTPDSK